MSQRSVFVSRKPQKSGREHFHKSVREYFACAGEYKIENVPLNLKSAHEPQKCREQLKKGPLISKLHVNIFRKKCP